MNEFEKRIVKIMEDEIPEGELVRVVRCKNCIHSEPNEIIGGCICRVDNSSRDDWFFCATGKRKSDRIMPNEVKYHLSCPECGRTWWSEEAFPKKCPYCGAER